MRQNQDTQKRSNLKSFIIIGLLLLLVAVIGFGGYTLSKYLTSKSETGTANVAKWGFTIKTDASKLFGTEYKWDETSGNSITTGEGSLTVKANTAEPQYNVVAPGTSGSMTFSINGSAEVLAQINIEISDNKDVVLNYTKDGTNASYNPIIWTVKKGETVLNTTDKTLKGVADALKTSSKIEAGQSVSDTYTIEWAWAFETGETDETKALNNTLDTALGVIANNGTNEVEGFTFDTSKSSAAISFTLNISVTQLAQ